MSRKVDFFFKKRNSLHPFCCRRIFFLKYFHLSKALCPETKQNPPVSFCRARGRRPRRMGVYQNIWHLLPASLSGGQGHGPAHRLREAASLAKEHQPGNAEPALGLRSLSPGCSPVHGISPPFQPPPVKCSDGWGRGGPAPTQVDALGKAAV